MAAYAALVSLRHIIEQIEHHPRPPISLDKTQLESLTEKITFLQEFLEGYSHFGYAKEANDLEMRVADAAYTAEDIIESHIVDQIHAGLTSEGEAIHSVDLYKGLQKVTQDMDLIKKEVVEAKQKIGTQDLMRRKSTPARSSSTRRSFMVGFDEVSYEIMDKLTGGESGRQIIPIVGMGGSGKTTLATNVYQNQVVVQRFDILGWVTISQEYRVRELLLELLSKEGGESGSQNECELGERLHRRLYGRRYLIVMDDIWDIQVWDQLKLFFPNNKNGSRIMLTTRLSNLAYEVAYSNVIKMGFLDENNSWDLFCRTVFGNEGCAFELEEIGKKIVQNCKGLPLAIVVVGGLLAKTECKQEYWEQIGRNLSSALNSEDEDSCLKILQMSYAQLPIYLRPCFLYMGVFKEDSEIRVSTLVKLWVAEGFLKPIRGKSMEIVAEEYLKDLIDRNLILVHQLGSTGSIKFCKVHDLLRDFCLREAEKERFYNVIGQHSLPQSINSIRRIVVLHSISKKKGVTLNTGSLVRSLICDSYEKLPSHDFRLLRILKASEKYSNHGREYMWEDMVKFVNSRYIAMRAHWDFQFASSIYHLWNLQTLIFRSMRYVTVPSEIWNMPQLRHIECEDGELVLTDPPSGRFGGQDEIVLANLQKLMTLRNFKCGEETVKRIPNIKNLKLHYELFKNESFDYCLNNLQCLQKLESFEGAFRGTNDLLRRLSFPHSLKKLTLRPFRSHHWEEIMEKIGSLPLLEKLRLRGCSFYGHKWETVEGQFRSLKYLEISGCTKLEYWTTTYTHFPCLEHLLLLNFCNLKGIPTDIGEIPTLQSIEVICCSDSAVISAREIAREQEEVGNEDLRVEVTLQRPSDEKALLMSLESTPNFQVKTYSERRWKML